MLQKKIFLTESWKPILNFSFFSLRGCWGQPMLLFWKLVDGNSNFPTSGIYRCLQTKSNLHISICQSHFKRNISMWDTLYIWYVAENSKSVCYLTRSLLNGTRRSDGLMFIIHVDFDQEEQILLSRGIWRWTGQKRDDY